MGMMSARVCMGLGYLRVLPPEKSCFSDSSRRPVFRTCEKPLLRVLCFFRRRMPDRPTWSGHLDEIVASLRDLPDAWIDRAQIQELLGVGPRRAQQILAPCVVRHVGVNGMAEREPVIAHLRRLATAEAAHYEQRRRRRLAQQLDALHEERRKTVMVAAPTAVVNQEFANLPEGVSVTPGRIAVTFGTVTEALEKLLALAMAIRNDELLFERLATGAK